MDLVELREKFESICNYYVSLFCQKHDLSYVNADWVGDAVGGTICIAGEHFIDFRDVRYDIDNDVPVGQYEAWDDYCDTIGDIELRYELLFAPDRGQGLLRHINYESWVAGAPRYSEEDLQKKSDELTHLEKMREKFLSRI